MSGLREADAENLIAFVRTFETGEAAAKALPIFLRALAAHATPSGTEGEGGRSRDASHLRCGSCGEQAVHFIKLRGFDVPACLRHLSHWRTPNFAPSEARDQWGPDLTNAEAEALSQAFSLSLMNVNIAVRRIIRDRLAAAQQRAADGGGEGALRERVAAEIEAQIDDPDTKFSDGLKWAAQIARGES